MRNSSPQHPSPSHCHVKKINALSPTCEWKAGLSQNLPRKGSPPCLRGTEKAWLSLCAHTQIHTCALMAAPSQNTPGEAFILNPVLRLHQNLSWHPSRRIRWILDYIWELAGPVWEETWAWSESVTPTNSVDLHSCSFWSCPLTTEEQI